MPNIKRNVAISLRWKISSISDWEALKPGNVDSIKIRLVAERVSSLKDVKPNQVITDS